MAKNKEIKTNAMRLLETKKIPYEAHTYECDEFVDGIQIADMLGNRRLRQIQLLRRFRIIQIFTYRQKRFHPKILHRPGSSPFPQPFLFHHNKNLSFHKYISF